MIRQQTRKQIFIGLILLVIVVLVRIPTFSLPLDNDSGAAAYHAQLILSGEPLYGTHHPAHHLPAIYYTYALIFKIFGNSPKSLQFFLVFSVWLIAWLIFRIGKQISGTTSGFCSAVFFILIGPMTNLAGDTAEIEMFANLPIVITIWMGGYYLRKKPKPISYVLIGIMGTICFLYKAVYLAPLAGIGAAMLLRTISSKDPRKWPIFLCECLAIILGILIILASLSIYVISIGLWERFLLVFTLGSGYVNFPNALPPVYIFIIPLILIGKANIALTSLGLLGFVRFLVGLPKSYREDQGKTTLEFLVSIWLVFTFVSAGFSRFGFSHYALLLVPPLSLIAGIEISELWQRTIKEYPSSSKIKLIILPSLMVFAILVNMGWSSQNYIAGYIRYLTNDITLTDFIRNDTEQGITNDTAVQVATYVKNNTRSNDTIFIWSDVAQIYYNANRRSSCDVIWPIYVDRLGPPERVFLSKPVMVIVDPKLFEKTIPEWLSKQLHQSYQLETQIENLQIYKRIG